MRPKHLAVGLAVIALLATPTYVAPASSAEPDSAPITAPAGPPSAPPVLEAEILLEEAQAALAETDDASARVGPNAASGNEVTLLLRDLAARRGELSPADKRVADALLARPTGGPTPFGVKYRTKSRFKCYPHVCLHWVTKGEDKPPLTDGPDRDKLPEWVETNGRTAEYIWRREVTRGGYRAPRPDLKSANHGPNKKLDIYLANLGDSGLYGFCTSDDPTFRRSRAISAYCVIDDDFSRREFGGKPKNVMAVTLAHEFFHAVQYSYDWREDAWLLEGTAAWIEEQVYDSINDNRQYLRTESPLSAPVIPLDGFGLTDSGAAGGHRYGVWTFFQYLGEKYPARYGGLPAIVRNIWAYADNSTSARPRQYSTQAVNTVLTRKHASSFANAFTDFSARNLHPARFYSEGAAWPAAPSGAPCSVTSASDCNGTLVLDHMSSSSAKLVPQGVANISVQVSTPQAFAGAKATLTIASSSGALSFRDVPVNGAAVPISATGLSYATITVSNGNIQFTCNRQRMYSCQGIPSKDNVTMTVTASAS